MIVFYVLLLLCASFSDAKRFRYDYTYNPEAEGWLKLHKIPANWADARLKCHNEGAELASPTSDRMKSAMTSLIANLPSCGAFTGVHAFFSKGDFFSIEGVPLARIPIRWAPGEPDNYENKENCLVLLSNGTMADVNCSDIFPYLCYRNKTQDMLITECGTVDLEYQLDRRTGNCYKFHPEPKSWWKAFATCAAEGGYLTIVNSDIEAQVIKDLFAKYPPNVIIGKFEKHLAHIGFYDWGEHGTFLTVHGQTLEKAGYAKFGEGQPDNMLIREFCGSILRNGLLNDISCERQFPFFCEKSQDSLYSLEDYKK